MIIIIPVLEIMKAVTDTNIDSDASYVRRKCNEEAIILKSIANVDLVLEGILYDKICARLLSDHKLVIQTIYRINNSAKGVAGYNVTSAIKWISEQEAKLNKVIIITDTLSNYRLEHKHILPITPDGFLQKIAIFKEFAEKLALTEKLGKDDAFTMFISIPYCKVRCNSCPYFKTKLRKDVDQYSYLEPYISTIQTQMTEYANTERFKSEGLLQSTWAVEQHLCYQPGRSGI